MFNHLTAWWRDKRVAWAYPMYREELKRAHLKKADVKFPLGVLQLRLDDLRAEAAAAAGRTHGSTDAIARELTRNASHLRERERELGLMGRDLAAELRDINCDLDAKYSQDRALRTEAAEIQGEVREAFGAIQHLYDRRKDWLGNPQPLPQWSFFGQSWNDLDALQDYLGDQKATQNDRWDEIADLGKKIREVSIHPPKAALSCRCMPALKRARMSARRSGRWGRSRCFRGRSGGDAGTTNSGCRS